MGSTTLTTKNFSLWNHTQVYLKVATFVTTTMGHCFELTIRVSLRGFFIAKKLLVCLLNFCSVLKIIFRTFREKNCSLDPSPFVYFSSCKPLDNRRFPYLRSVKFETQFVTDGLAVSKISRSLFPKRRANKIFANRNVIRNTNISTMDDGKVP